MERATIFVQGRVQGVGFRWWVRARALELGLIGFARNLADGRVEVGRPGRAGGRGGACGRCWRSSPGPPGDRGRYRCTVQHGACATDLRASPSAEVRPEPGRALTCGDRGGTLGRHPPYSPAGSAHPSPSATSGAS